MRIKSWNLRRSREATRVVIEDGYITITGAVSVFSEVSRDRRRMAPCRRG